MEVNYRCRQASVSLYPTVAEKAMSASHKIRGSINQDVNNSTNIFYSFTITRNNVHYSLRNVTDSLLLRGF